MMMNRIEGKKEAASISRSWNTGKTLSFHANNKGPKFFVRPQSEAVEQPDDQGHDYDKTHSFEDQ